LNYRPVMALGQKRPNEKSAENYIKLRFLKNKKKDLKNEKNCNFEELYALNKKAVGGRKVSD